MPSSTYFSIDYRSPPSGLGQIVRPNRPKMVGGKHNMVNVGHHSALDGDYHTNDAYYIDEKVFVTQDEWFNLDDISELYDYLLSQGVETVYDSEMSYDYPGYFDENKHIMLSDWIEIFKQSAII